MTKYEADASQIASDAGNFALAEIGMCANELGNDGCDDDKVGRVIAHRIYLNLLTSNAHPSEIVGWFDRVVGNISSNLGLDWELLKTKSGTIDDYLSDSMRNLREVFPEIVLVENWETRLAAFDYVAKLVPLVIRMANGRQECAAGGDGFEVGYKLGDREKKLAIYAPHAQHFGFRRNEMQHEFVDGYPVFFPRQMEDECRSFIENSLLDVMFSAKEHAIKMPRMKSGLGALDAIFLIGGTWLYASNSELLHNGGSSVFYGMEREKEDGKENDRGLAHELDHLDYLSKRAGKQEVSAFVQEARAISTEVEYAMKFNKGLIPSWKLIDLNTYKRIMESDSESVESMVNSGNGVDSFVPAELYYQNGYFGKGNKETWSAIVDGLGILG